MAIYNLSSSFFFGKYKGKTVKEVIDTGPTGREYLRWASSKPDFVTLDDDVKFYLKTGKVPEKKDENAMYNANEFWGNIVINGPRKESEVPF